MKDVFQKFALPLLSVSLMIGSTAMAAETRQRAHETDFTVKFGGVTVGTVTFGVTMDGARYTFTGDGRTQGLADWFAPGKAVIRSNGNVSASRIVADSHFLSVTENEKTATLKMSFKSGDVHQVSLTPQKKKKRKPHKYVTLTEEHLKNVVDPASTMVVPVSLSDAKNPEAVCNRTFNVYDGETRFDIALNYKSNQRISTKGYDGYAYVCQLKYVPVAGHEKKHKSVKRMAANEEMEIWLAPIDGGGEDQSVFTAIRIVVPTWIGTFAAEPTYFGSARR